jgi:hypothetical protein
MNFQDAAAYHKWRLLLFCAGGGPWDDNNGAGAHGMGLGVGAGGSMGGGAGGAGGGAGGGLYGKADEVMRAESTLHGHGYPSPLMGGAGGAGGSGLGSMANSAASSQQQLLGGGGAGLGKLGSSSSSESGAFGGGGAGTKIDLDATKKYARLLRKDEKVRTAIIGFLAVFGSVFP